MKDRRIARMICHSGIWIALLTTSLSASAAAPRAMNTWTYHKERDKSNNVAYSLVRSPIPRRGVYDTLRLEIICKNSTLRFGVDSYNLITSKGSTFDFDYRIDNGDARTITMRTYQDTKRRGYTDSEVERIVAEILSGQSIFIRVHTLITRVLSSVIWLEGAAQPLQRVFADCGRSLPGGDGKGEAYSLSDLQRDLEALSPERQRQLLDRFREIIERSP